MLLGLPIIFKNGGLRMPRGKKSSWTHAIYCDYGKADARIIRLSYSSVSAKNAWEKIYKSYSHNNWRCWQVTKRGKVIRDSNKIKEKVLN